MKFLYLILLSTFFLSCTGEKIITNNYLTNLSDTSGKILINIPEATVQINDLLYIRVFSMSIRPETDIPYNLPEQNLSGSEASPISGFLVNREGNIEYPRIGTIKVFGLTRDQVAEEIRKRLSNELTNPSVIVRFLNYKVTVLGEVRTPGSFTSPTERITILDALGMAGDVTEYGSRNLVKIARENNGQVEIGYVDLTSKNLFTSPYFRLQQNDVVFVEQTSRRAVLQEQQNRAFQIGVATSIISTLAILLNYFR
ncbi:MAG TPA: polysaccharide biosynthesis/export family protein [Flavisolibacter sp.]|nr:polysaccharide biosynthesis/export family protein [Flavisolibacter sp.]